MCLGKRFQSLDMHKSEPPIVAAIGGSSFLLEWQSTHQASCCRYLCLTICKHNRQLCFNRIINILYEICNFILFTCPREYTIWGVLFNLYLLVFLVCLPYTVDNRLRWLAGYLGSRPLRVLYFFLSDFVQNLVNPRRYTILGLGMKGSLQYGSKDIE